MRHKTSVVAIAALLTASCGGGGGGSGSGPQPEQQNPPVTPTTAVFQTPQAVGLSVADVQRIIAQGVAEAQAQNQPSGFVVIDRVGNVLAAFQMNGTNLTLRTPPAPNGQNGPLQGLNIPGAAFAGGISKALTSSYFSSVGAAFSSRTANDILQETLPPSAATRGLESGPLFSVQFSQLPCSDVSSQFPNRSGTHRGPLGAGADPGSFPLYRNGTVIGAVAVIGDGVYGFDTEYRDNDRNVEEVIALAATSGFEPPAAIRADRVTVDGFLLRYSDATPADFRSNPASAPGFAAINGVIGNLVTIRGYYNMMGGVLPGTVYGSEESGVRPATAAEFAIPEAWVVSQGGVNRYPAIAGTDGANALTANETRALLEEAFLVQRQARAQLRIEQNGEPQARAQNTIVVVDTNGQILGLVRAPDALADAIDAVPQKARTTVFFASATAGAYLQANPRPGVAPYVQAVRSFLNDPNALTGQTAFSLRAIGNLARPWFPDGQLGQPPGPLSVPIEQFNIFNTGLQARLIEPDVLQHVTSIVNPAVPDTLPGTCTGSALNPGSAIVPATGRNRIPNGITLFAGGVPIYRNGVLVGAIAASGDGNDQSDMIAFLGLHNAGIRLGGAIGNAPVAIRSDRINVPLPSGSSNLRYVRCPFAPFVGTNDQNVCDGK